jgi:hypothetical protein
MTRSITTRPTVEWTEQKRWDVKIDEDQVPEVETPSSLNKWMDIRFKNKNKIETKLYSIAIDETRKTNPLDARNVSDAKLKALQASLMSRGLVFLENVFNCLTHA